MQVNREPLYKQAHAAVRERIINGELKPGSRVDVQTIADELDISRTPVREAIRQLTQEGLLEPQRDGRVHVYSPSVDDLAEIYIVRAALEGMAALVTSSREPPPDLTVIEEAHARGVAAVRADDWKGVADANTDFHEGLVRLSENANSLRILDSVRFHVRSYRQLSMQFPQRREVAAKAHGQILELLHRRDTEAVRQKVYGHVILAGAWAVTNLKPDAAGDTPSTQYLRRSLALHLEG